MIQKGLKMKKKSIFISFLFSFFLLIGAQRSVHASSKRAPSFSRVFSIQFENLFSYSEDPDRLIENLCEKSIQFKHIDPQYSKALFAFYKNKQEIGKEIIFDLITKAAVRHPKTYNRNKRTWHLLAQKYEKALEGYKKAKKLIQECRIKDPEKVEFFLYITFRHDGVCPNSFREIYQKIQNTTSSLK